MKARCELQNDNEPARGVDLDCAVMDLAEGVTG